MPHTSSELFEKYTEDFKNTPKTLIPVTLEIQALPHSTISYETGFSSNTNLNLEKTFGTNLENTFGEDNPSTNGKIFWELAFAFLVEWNFD